MEIKAKNEVLENANEFVYLSSVLTRDNDHQGHQGKNRNGQGVMAGLNLYHLEYQEKILKDQIKCLKSACVYCSSVCS